MKDFTIQTYKKLLKSLLQQGFSFQTFEQFIELPKEKTIILRHDVDEKPKNALKIAQAEFELGIESTFYFRIIKKSNNPDIIKKIAEMGHEIGYHYEVLSANYGKYEAAIKDFKTNLEYFRSFYPVKTVCMHGSSMSKFDNRDLWSIYSLTDFGIIGELYLSIDFNKVFYITDTGRCWDGNRFCIRDKVKDNFNLSFHTTYQIIDTITNNKFPNQTLLLAHTLWTDNFFEWWWLEIREIVRNNVKTCVVKIPFLRRIAFRLIQKISNV